MGVQSSMSSKVWLRLLIGVLTIISLEGMVASVNLKHDSFEPPCHDDVMKVYYIRNDTNPCTATGFQSECPPGTPPFNLQPFGWRHADADDYEYNFSRLRSELERSGHACFAPLSASNATNVSSPEPPPHPNNPSLAFLHNCSSFPIVDLPDPHSTCPSGGANRSYVVLVIDGQEDVPLNPSACESHTIVPVKFARTDGEETEDGDYKEKLMHGIRLQWNLTSWETCVKCYQSGGECMGEDASFLCLCHGGKTYPHTCKRGCGIGALAIIFLCSHINRICFKRKNSFLIFRSSHASSDSSLKADVEAGNEYFAVPIFTNAELEEATNHFDSSWELGDGGFGTVYYGKLRDGREVAVKRLNERNCLRVRQFMTEVEILTRLRHKNLVSLYGCTSRHSRELLLVYEYIPNGTVADHLHGKRAKQDPLRWPTRISIAIETATALAYLHASDIIHRDVKTNNILLDKNFCVKVADFGLSRLYPNNVSHVSTAPQGTPGYVDPEYHQCYQLTEKSDVYSFGVVLVELISSLPAVDISRDRHEINLANFATSKIQNRRFSELIDPTLGFKLDPEINRMTMAVAELAFRCLQQDKDMRPSMATVLEELKAISSETNESDKRKDVSNDSSACQIKNPPLSQECDVAGLLKNKKLPTSPVSVTQKWGSSGSSSVHSG